MTDAPKHALRLRSLDGLRGLAAVIVLAHHLSMTIPAISNAYDSSSNLAPFSLAWWFVGGPAKTLVAGPEFVLVFFVLSGFVLTLSPLSRAKREDNGDATARYDWAAYYPRRIVRLGIPVVASMVLAYIVIAVPPHPTVGGAGSWLTRQAHPNISLSNLVTETLLIADPQRPSVNPPLWSLTWELWFSLLLPLAVVIALWSRRAPVLWGLFFCGASLVGYIHHETAAMYLPAFALGALLGVNAHRIHGAVARATHTKRLTAIWIGLVIAGPALSTSYWMLRPLLSGPTADAALALRVPGAAIMVATVAFCPAASRIFESRGLAWLGKISFSLYLVHSPVVVCFGLLFVGSPWWIGAVLSLATTLVLTLMMYSLVEKPSIELASRTGRRVSALVALVAARLGKATPTDLAEPESAHTESVLGESVLGAGAPDTRQLEDALRGSAR
ncbi:MAG TPA: acyltransferase [Lacisediminihabitans sp.]|nr:acyltransferase [Lacisediminihabitans sp.]HXD60384.1 acyltransferase [Lacisediminihabitans sp.]